MSVAFLHISNEKHCFQSFPYQVGPFKFLQKNNKTAIRKQFTQLTTSITPQNPCVSLKTYPQDCCFDAFELMRSQTNRQRNDTVIRLINTHLHSFVCKFVKNTIADWHIWFNKQFNERGFDIADGKKLRRILMLPLLTSRDSRGFQP